MVEEMMKEDEFEPVDEIHTVEDELADEPGATCECGCCEDGDIEYGCEMPFDPISEIEEEEKLPDPEEVKRKIRQSELDELNKKFEDAMGMCLEKHKGQKDLVGDEYSDHPCRIANAIYKEKILESMDKIQKLRLMTIALLHDIIEDTDITEVELREKFGNEITDAVVALTRTDEDGDYVDYILRVEKNEDARWVKYFDLLDNLNILRFYNHNIELKEKDMKRLNKYGDAYLYLKKKMGLD